MTVEEVLTEAHRLLKKKNGWAKYHFFGRYDKDMDQCVDSSVDSADCFCSLGAIRYVAGVYNVTTNQYERDEARDLATKANALLKTEVPSRYIPSLVDFNDDGATEKKDVLALFRRGIKKAQKEGV